MSDQNNNNLLSVEKLQVVYGNVAPAIQGVSLTIENSQIVSLLGTNGAGKTTTLRAISGFLGIDDAKVTEGSIVFEGARITNKPPHVITQKGIVLVPERNKVFESLTVEENLLVCQAPKRSGRNRQEVNAAIFNYFPVLRKLKNRLGGYMSGGERQMLAIATALLSGPKLMLLDELSLGLAPLIVSELMRLVRKIRDENGIAVLLVEQNAKAALAISEYGYVIENGRIVFAGDSEKLESHQDIQEFYLGQSEMDSRKSYRDVKQYRRTRRWYG